MSDFLSKFTNDNYEELIDEKVKDTVKDADVITEAEVKSVEIESDPTPLEDSPVEMESVEAVKEAIIEPHEQVEQVDMVEIAEESPQEEVVEPVARIATRRKREDMVEETEIDPTYHKRKMMRNGLIVAGIAIACASIFGLYFIMNRITMPNFIDKPISDAKTWGLKNRIELEITEKFSIEMDTGNIIMQSKEADKKISKGSVLKLDVSKGADPDETLQLTEVLKMTLPKLEEWKRMQRAEGMKIIQEFHESEPKGKILRYEFSNAGVTEATYKRKDTIKVFVSKGIEVYEKNIEVPDFKNKPLEEIIKWGQTNDVQIESSLVAHDTIMAGNVTGQSIASGEKIAKKTVISVSVSQGKAAIVPSYAGLSKVEAENFQVPEGVQVIIREWYSSSVGYGYFIYQSVDPGTEFVGDDDRTVEVYYSTGRPYVDHIVGKTEKDLEAYFYDFQSKGAYLSYSVSYENSLKNPDGSPMVERGIVIRSSKDNQYVGMEDHINVIVSLG